MNSNQKNLPHYIKAAPVKQRTKSQKANSGLYANIGETIKKWAKTIFVLETIACILFAVITLVYSISDGDEDAFLLALLVAGLGPLLAYVSTWLLYAYGELVDKTCANEQNTRQIVNLMLEFKENSNQE